MAGTALPNPWSQGTKGRGKTTKKKTKKSAYQVAWVMSARPVTANTRKKYADAIRAWVSRNGGKVYAWKTTSGHVTAQLTATARALVKGKYRTRRVGPKGAKIVLFQIPVGSAGTIQKPTRTKAQAKKKTAKKKTAKKKTTKKKARYNVGQVARALKGPYNRAKKAGSRIAWKTAVRRAWAKVNAGAKLESVRKMKL